MHIFHKWSAWSEYVVEKVWIPDDPKKQEVKFTEAWQKRHCVKCGYIESRKIRDQE